MLGRAGFSKCVAGRADICIAFRLDGGVGFSICVAGRAGIYVVFRLDGFMALIKRSWYVDEMTRLSFRMHWWSVISYMWRWQAISMVVSKRKRRWWDSEPKSADDTALYRQFRRLRRAARCYFAGR